MASRRVDDEKPKQTSRRPATTPDARQNQLISAATDLAERQIREGTASAMVITHYLKLGSSRNRLEELKIERELELIRAKQEQLAAQQHAEEMYAKALDAMRQYAGHEVREEDAPIED